MAKQIPPRPGVKVFWNRSNTISIQQVTDGPGVDPDDEQVVVVHPEDAYRFIKMFQNVVMQVEDDEAPESKPAPPNRPTDA